MIPSDVGGNLYPGPVQLLWPRVPSLASALKEEGVLELLAIG